MMNMRIVVLIFLSNILISQDIYSQGLEDFITFDKSNKILLYPNREKKISDSLYLMIYESRRVDLSYFSEKKGNDSIKINGASFSLEEQYMTPDVTVFEFNNRTYLFICAYLLADVLFHEYARDGYLFDITDRNNIKKYVFKKKYVSALYFGDFNKDGNLDVLDLEGISFRKSFLEKISKDSVDYYDYFEITCYSLIDNSFQILNTSAEQPFYLLCGIGVGSTQPSSIVFESKWFF